MNTAPEAGQGFELTDILFQWLNFSYERGGLTPEQFPESKIHLLARAIVAQNLDRLSRVLSADAYAAVPDACRFLLDTGREPVLHHGETVDLDGLRESLEDSDGSVTVRQDAEEETGPETTIVEEDPAREAPPAPTGIGEPELAITYGEFAGQAVTAPQRTLFTQPASETSVRLLWTAPQRDHGVTVYRIVTHDEFLPPHPGFGRTVASVTDNQCVIELPQRSPLRFVQVWAYSADTVLEAGKATPVYVGDALLVAKPVHIETQTSYGSVNCTWDLPQGDPGGTRMHVEIVRFPKDAPGGYDGPDGTPVVGRTGVGGFVDPDAPAGDVVYRATVQVNLPQGGVGTSMPCFIQARVPARIVPVEGLAAQRDPDAPSRAVISWDTPQQGRVVIYQSPEPPPPGHNRAPQPAEVVGQILVGCEPIKYPQEPTGDGRTLMTGVPLPDGWVGVYYTPVTILQDQALIGQPLYFNNGSGAPVRFTIVERVSHQLLRFGWPSGVDAVAIHVAALGAGTEVLSGPPTQVITASQYRSHGGFEIKLDWTGATVYATSLTQHGGRAQQGESARCDYPGVLPMTYSLRTSSGLKVFSKPTVSVSLWTDDGRIQGNPVYRRPVQFVCVYNHARLPLHEADGELVPLAQKDSGATPQPVSTLMSIYNGPGGDVFEGQVPGKSGYLRVFLHMDAEALQHFALLDPAVSSLRVG